MKEVKIRALKYDRSLHREWTAVLLSLDGDSVTLQGVFREAVSHPFLGEIQAGTVSIEHYWAGEWYNVFCFYNPDGTFRNYYCNITMPPEISPELIQFIDLDLDVVAAPNSQPLVFDEDEFRLNSVRFRYPEEVIGQAYEALEALRHLMLLCRIRSNQ